MTNKKAFDYIIVGAGSAGCVLASELEYVKKNCATAYHPVGTLRMGEDKQAPVSPRLTVNGVKNLWVADASVMPEITSANTNAPSMMIGFLAAKFIAEDKA